MSVLGIINFDLVRVDHGVDTVANQPAGNRVGVAFDLNRAAGVDLDARDALAMVELARRQVPQASLLG